MPQPTFKNAIRIRRNDSYTSSVSAPGQESQDLELQPVQGAVPDTAGAGEHRARRDPGIIAPPPRQSSLLERLVREDLATSGRGGGEPITRIDSNSDTSYHSDHEAATRAMHGLGTGEHVSSVPNTRRTGALDRVVRELDILPEAAEETTPSAEPSHPPMSDSGLAADRPGYARAGPSRDRQRDSAPGPRLNINMARLQAVEQSRDFSGGATASRTSSTPVSTAYTRPDATAYGPTMTPLGPSRSQHIGPQGQITEDEGPTKAMRDEPSKHSLLGAFTRRGRSYTLPGRQGASNKETRAVSPSRDWQMREDARAQEQDLSMDDEDHEDGVVDYLDVVDPEVGVLNHMSNIQNSIFLPSFSDFFDRRITHTLPKTSGADRRGSVATDQGSIALEEGRPGSMSPISARQSSPTALRRPAEKPTLLRRVSTAMTFGGRRVSEPLPQHIDMWENMDEGERHELDVHVAHLLSRPQRFRRGFRGFLKWARTPIGFIMLCYGLAITGWGIAICLFIFDWTTIKDRHERRLWIEYCDQVLCALFAAVGLGFAPFRAMDTWRMIHIAHFHHLSWKRRKQYDLPKLNDPNDLPRPRGYNEAFPPPAGAATHQSIGTKEHSTPPSQRSSSSDSLPELGRQGRATTESERLSSPGLSPTDSLPLRGADAQRTSFSKKQRWHVPTKSEKEERKRAAEAAMRTVQDVGQGRVESAQPPVHRTISVLSEEIVKKSEDVVVLNPQEQQSLSYHQRKFHKSHHYYRYHETATHRAFPLDLLIVIVCLLDCHSLLQGALGGVTWGIRYQHRPTALTATLISCSLSCNAVAGFLIYLGGRRTKKTEETKRRLRLAIEGEALRRIQNGMIVPPNSRKRIQRRDGIESGSNGRPQMTTTQTEPSPKMDRTGNASKHSHPVLDEKGLPEDSRQT
ncbi:unnamed protein product [Parajaminaea phylloscopi]